MGINLESLLEHNDFTRALDSESPGIGDGEIPGIQVLNDFSCGNEPDENLEKTDQRGQEPVTFKDENRPERTHGNVQKPGEKYDYGEKHWIPARTTSLPECFETTMVTDKLIVPV